MHSHRETRSHNVLTAGSSSKALVQRLLTTLPATLGIGHFDDFDGRADPDVVHRLWRDPSGMRGSVQFKVRPYGVILRRSPRT